MISNAAASSNFEAVRESARANEADRYLSALLAPKEVRGDLIALAALVGEVRRIPRLVADPHLAEIRLRWWRDALIAADGETGNPVADAARGLVLSGVLPRQELETWFDAFAHTFYAAPPEDEAHLELEHQLIEGPAFSAAARVLGAVAEPVLAAPLRHGAVAYGVARLACEFPYALRRGRIPLPGFGNTVSPADLDTLRAKAMMTSLARKNLEAVRASYAGLATPLRAALLPLALVEPYLGACERQGHDLKSDLGEIAPLSRVTRLWRANIMRRI